MEIHAFGGPSASRALRVRIERFSLHFLIDIHAFCAQAPQELLELELSDFHCVFLLKSMHLEAKAPREPSQKHDFQLIGSILVLQLID